MLRFIFSRFLQAILVILAVYTITFVMVRAAPGDPFREEKEPIPEVTAELYKQYGMDKWLIHQYWIGLTKMAVGDFGPSMKIRSMQNVKIIKDSFPISLAVGLAALGIGLAIGLPAGIIAALRKNTWLDFGPMSLALIGISLPSFVMGPCLLAIFGLKLRIFSVGGWFEPSDWVLPAVTMGLGMAAYIARLTRGGMLEVLNQDFIRTARAKGVPGWLIVIRHTLRGGLLPVAAYLGPAVAGVTTGSIIIEKIFHLPGLGQHYVSAVMNRDYTLIMATTVLYAGMLVLMNFLADVLVVWMNPKVRLS